MLPTTKQISESVLDPALGPGAGPKSTHEVRAAIATLCAAVNSACDCNGRQHEIECDAGRVALMEGRQ